MPVSFACPTVKVVAPGGGFIRINASDFDEAVHTLYAEPAEAEEAKPEAPAELPGFNLFDLNLNPQARESLRDAGLSTATAIVTASANPEWHRDVLGVGPRVAERIVEAAREFIPGE